MIGNYEEYPEMLNRLFLEDKTKGFEAKTEGLYARTITFQVTEDCCMKCSMLSTQQEAQQNVF